MKNDDEQSSLMLAVIGIIPVIWFALLVAPYLSSGLMGILDGVPEAMNHPFSIRLCGDSVKTVLIFLLSYGMEIGIYISTKKHYRRGEEHGSAKWGNVKKINRRYKEKRFTKNKLLTMHVQISYNMRKHLRNVLTVVIGGSGSGKTRFFAKPNLMQANTSFVVLDPKGENLRDTWYLLEEKGYEVRVLDLINMEKSHCYNPFVYLKDDNDVQRLVTNLFKATTPKGSQSNDPFWDTAASMLLLALIFYLRYEAPEEEQNFPMVMEMKRMAPGCTNTVEYEIYGLDGSAKFSTEDANAVWYTRNQGREQAWSRLILGQRTLFPVITGGIFEFGFSDAMLQMFAAFIAELCGEPCAFGCFRPDEALLSHQLLTGALRAYETGSVVRLD